MKPFVFALVVFSFVGLAHAQIDAPSVIISGETMAGAEGLTAMRGSVAFELPGGARITADEADINHAGAAVALRGNVIVSLPRASFPTWSIRVRR